MTRQEFVKKMKTQLDKWNAQIDVMGEKADKVEASMRDEYNKQLETLIAKREDARAKLEKLEKASDSAWEDLKSGVEMAWRSVSEAVDSATNRYKF